MGVRPSTGTWDPTSSHILHRRVLPPSESVCSHQLLGKEWGLEAFYSIHARILASLILCRFHKGNHSSCPLMTEIAMSCLEDSVWQHLSPSFSSSFFFPPSLLQCSQALVVMGLIQVFCLGLDVRWLSLSILPGCVSLCWLLSMAERSRWEQPGLLLITGNSD